MDFISIALFKIVIPKKKLDKNLNPFPAKIWLSFLQKTFIKSDLAKLCI